MREMIADFFGNLMGFLLFLACLDGGTMLYQFFKHGNSVGLTLCRSTNLCGIDTEWVGVNILFYHFVNTPVWKWSLWGAFLSVLFGIFLPLLFVEKKKSY